MRARRAGGRRAAVLLAVIAGGAGSRPAAGGAPPAERQLPGGAVGRSRPPWEALGNPLFSPDLSRCASQSRDGIRVYDWTAQRELARVPGVDDPLAFSPDGRILAGRIRGPKDEHHLILWDVDAGREIRRLSEHPSWRQRAAFSPDGRTLATGDEDEEGHSARLWDVQSGRAVCELRGHRKKIEGLAFAPDGKRLVTGGDDVVLLWDLATRKPTPLGADLQDFSFSADGALLAGTGDGGLSVWSVPAGKTLLRFDRRARDRPRAAAFSPDGSRIALACGDKIRIREFPSGNLVRTLAAGESFVEGLRFAPAGGGIESVHGSLVRIRWSLDAAAGAPAEDPEAGLQETRALAAGVRAGMTRADVEKVFPTQDAGIETPDATRYVEPPDLVVEVPYDQEGGDWEPGNRVRGAAVVTRTAPVAAGPPPVLGGPGDPQPAALVARLGIPPMGHSGPASSVAWSPDGRRLASAGGGYSGSDNLVRVWDAATGGEVAALAGHSDSVNAVAFSPDGRSIASGGDDDVIRVWDAATRTERLAIPTGGARVFSVAFSPDGKRIAAGTSRILVRDAATGADAVRIEWEDAVSGCGSVAFSPDGATLAGGCSDGTIRLFEAATGKPLRTLEGHEGIVNALAFSPDGSILLSGEEEAKAIFWNVADGTRRSKPRRHGGPVHSVAFSPDGKLAATSDEGVIHLADPARAKELRRIEGLGGTVTSVAFSPDGQTLASAGNDGKVRLWSVATGASSGAPASAGPIESVCFSPDGATLLSAGNRVQLWDAAAGREETGFDSPIEARCAAFSPDGNTLATGGERRVRSWEVGSRKERIYPADGLEREVRHVAFSPDGRILAVVGEGDPGIGRAIFLRDAGSGNPLRTLAGGAGPCRFSPDGSRLAAPAVEGERPVGTRLWNVATGEAVRDLPGTRACAFSPDGQTLVTASETRVFVWDAATGRARGRIRPELAYFTALAFSPDGRVLAGAGGSAAGLWDAASGRFLCVLAGHRGTVLTLAFSPDGRRLATGSEDTSILVWSVDSLLPQRK